MTAFAPSADPALQIQDALAARLLADPGVAALVADRVWDRPPPLQPGHRALTFPYVSFGTVTTQAEETDETEFGETRFEIHVWSRTAGKREAHALVDAIRRALRQPLALSAHVVDTQETESVIVLADPDGVTTHAVVQIRLQTHPV